MGIQEELTQHDGQDNFLEPEMPKWMVEQSVRCRCRDCWHWDYDETKEDEEKGWHNQVGTCRRYPLETATIPQANQMTGEVQLKVIPIQKPAPWDHWCGEYTRALEWPGFAPPPGGYVVPDDVEIDLDEVRIAPKDGKYQ